MPSRVRVGVGATVSEASKAPHVAYIQTPAECLKDHEKPRFLLTKNSPKANRTFRKGTCAMKTKQIMGMGLMGALEVGQKRP